MAIAVDRKLYRPVEDRTFFTDDGQFTFLKNEVYSEVMIELKLKSIGFIIYDLNKQVLKYFKVVR